jgi:hypothetical protein
MTPMTLRSSISIILLFVANTLFAQVKFTASVNSATVGTGEPFEITFSVNGNASDFMPPEFQGFQVVGGPNQSTSMEMINGTTTVSMSYGYELVAIKEGDFTIGPASVVINGRKLTSNAIKLKVVKGRPVQQTPQQTQLAPAGNVRPGNTSDLSKLIFIRAEVDKTDVYQGQQITLDYKLYTRIGISQSAPDVAPSLNGFWSEDVKQQGPIQFRREMYKGQVFEVADIKKTILFPEHTGNLTIDPLGVMFVVQVPTSSGDDVFDQLLGGMQQVKYEAKSTPVTIHVKPLPTAGKPASFAGAVGNFSIESTLDKTEVKANDALNYKVAIKGAGNLKLLQSLTTGFPADFEKYDPKIADTIRTTESGMAGTRYFTYLLIPRHQGDFTIDPFKFSWFNPATGRYYELATKAFQIKVDKGAAQNNVTAFSDADKQDVKMLSKDIRYIKTGDAGLRKPGGDFFGSFWYYLLFLLGPVLAYTAYQYRNWQIKTNSDIVKVKSRKAGKIAAKHLANAQKQLLANNNRAFYEDIFRGLYGYLSDKLNIQYASLDRETIVTALRSKSVSEPVVGRLTETLDLCDMARYAPVTHISEKDVFEKAKGIINDIEDEI